MSIHHKPRPPAHMDRLARAATAMGFEIVDIAGFLDLLEARAQTQRNALSTLNGACGELGKANAGVSDLAADLRASVEREMTEVESSVLLVRDAGERARGVASWVQALDSRSAEVRTALGAVDANNAQIANIAAQVNTLAINAKIEAARAGESGRGFAVVADAINDLSQKTGQAATNISENISQLASWLGKIGREAAEIADSAGTVITQSEETNAALEQVKANMQARVAQVERIDGQSRRAAVAMDTLAPSVADLDKVVNETSDGVEQTHARMLKVIDVSEVIVQSVSIIGGSGIDAPFITYVQNLARDISTALEAEVAEGRISMARLFDRNYVPVKGSNPAQFVTRATSFFDDFLPRFQEPALRFDDKVIFCAAVDVNGYLPTHNAIFSQPQGKDVVWNTSHCRNRRIFNDRVGLKAGRSRAPFLLQVYRRDMGGGEFRMMKDLSAPLRVQGQHWGGIRLAYGY